MRPPCGSAAAAVRCNSASRRPASTTEYPARCSVRLTARPIPLPAPVTRAIFISPDKCIASASDNGRFMAMGDRSTPRNLLRYRPARQSAVLSSGIPGKLAEHSRDPTGRRAGFLDAATRRRYRAGCTTRPPVEPIAAGAVAAGRKSWQPLLRLVGPKDAPPFKGRADFHGSRGAIILRDIRHHDDHSPLNPQSSVMHYLPVTVRELRREEYAPSPWTAQARFAGARQPVRILKGHPGSGKTTALWHAADSTGAERVLYVTYSSDLAGLARNHFDRYCSSEKHFHVVTFPNLMRESSVTDAPVSTEHRIPPRVHARPGSVFPEPRRLVQRPGRPLRRTARAPRR